MVIQHNLSAMVAGEANRKNVSGLRKKTEKLSTGYKINRAADNASGLAVSEKMRSQIRGLTQATNNANDAVSLIQTAEGGLNETEDLLQRMRELAVQSANGTYTDEDRQQIQFEVDALKGEIDRVSESTEYNEMKLLNGELNVTLNTKVPSNECGARYGSINHDLAIGGGKISVTSSIEGVWLKFTTGASGKGGENAYYAYDTARTNGDLNQHIVINLAEGQHYTDEQINDLINNAKTQKSNDDLSTWTGWPVAKAKVAFKSEVGSITAAEAETYQLVTGDQYQRFYANTRSLGEAKPETDASAVSYSTRTVNTSKSFSLNFDSSMTAGTFTIDKGAGTIKVGVPAEFATAADASNFMNTLKTNVFNELDNGTTYFANTVDSEPTGQDYLDKDGNPVKNDRKAALSWNSFGTNNYRAHTVYQTDSNGVIQRDSSGNPIVDRVYYTLNSENVRLGISKTQAVAQKDTSSSYSFTITANQYGSYSDYLANVDKYAQPDAINEFNHNAISKIKFVTSSTATDNVSVSIDTSAANPTFGKVNSVTVTLKEGATITGDPIKAAIQDALNAGGFNYTVQMTESKYSYTPTLTDAQNNAHNTIYERSSGNNDRDFVVKSGTVNAGYAGPSPLYGAGHRSIKRVGTIPGERQVAEGDLTPLLIQPGSGTAGSSDHIRFTANSYGKAYEYDNIVQEFVISTDQDLPAGEETVEINGETATIRLATGTKYTNKSLQNLLKKAGLDYTVELTDSHSPDGDKDGSVYFNTSSSVIVSQTVAGQGVGLTDIADISDKLEFQIGANGVEDQKADMELVDASTEALGVANVSVATQDDANEAIETIDEAIKKVSTFRATMGAMQNRMEYSVNSLNTSNENLTASESQIRDTDVASEMVEYQKNNILQQASQAMLAQANQQTNGILSLLG